MRRPIGIRLMTLGLLAASTLWVPSLAAPQAMAARAPCADLTVTASPPILPPGDPETVSGSLTNCSNQIETITVQARVTGPCGFSMGRSFQVVLPPGQTVSRDLTFPAPNCEGIYTGKARALSQGLLLDQAEASFKVCTNCQDR